MKLTGKCKKDFEKWLYQNYDNELYYSEVGCSEEGINLFNTHESMRYGVYVDFFDNIGVNINISGKIGGIWNLLFCYEIWDNNKGMTYYKNRYKSRPKARLEVIKKANEIYNLNN